MPKTILCIGAGYVGGPTMAVIADRCPDLSVTGAAVDRARRPAWDSGRPPAVAPALE